MRRFHLALLACLLGGAALPAAAQSEIIQPGEERFSFAIGYVFQWFNTDLRVDNLTIYHTSAVDLRNDFGLERDDAGVWANAEWRFAPRHRIGFSYSKFSLSGTRTATRQIEIGDEIYPVGATLTSEFKLQVIPILYSYSFFKNERQEIAATVGVHWSKINFKANGSTSLSGQDPNTEVNAKLNAPLPLLGLRYDHDFSRRWSAGLRGGAFSLKFGEDTTKVQGKIWTLDAYGEYRFAKHLGVGLSIEGINLDVDASYSSWQGAINYRVWGPQVYLKARY